MERWNKINFPFIDSFKIQTLVSIFMFKQFMDKSDDILLPSISYTIPAYKYLNIIWKLETMKASFWNQFIQLNPARSKPPLFYN
jgi:hypothetical protein